MVYISQSEKKKLSLQLGKIKFSQDLFWFFVSGQGGIPTLGWKVSDLSKGASGDGTCRLYLEF